MDFLRKHPAEAAMEGFSVARILPRHHRRVAVAMMRICTLFFGAYTYPLRQTATEFGTAKWHTTAEASEWASICRPAICRA